MLLFLVCKNIFTTILEYNKFAHIYTLRSLNSTPVYISHVSIPRVVAGESGWWAMSAPMLRALWRQVMRRRDFGGQEQLDETPLNRFCT